MNQRNKGKLAVKLRRFKAVMKKNKADKGGPIYAAAAAKHGQLLLPPSK
ncbi:MAG: hypothetical protein HY854_14555 [Burkholderiales bacterium]|nr:hypothetical protein [Burkholderiales bacterium]